MQTDQKSELKAVLLDLDGVITRTARAHARAWEEMFNDYLRQHSQRSGEPFRPFDPQHDYEQFVDGKPRYDGVRSFLESRGIDLPQGEPSDPPDRETVCGLGNRKNQFYHRMLSQEGVQVFDDAVRQIVRWRERGLKTAVISSSRNCKTVLETAGLLDLFDERVDGMDLADSDMEGKPAPDIFLEAAQRLNISPDEAVVIEDAISGVQAGSRGHFALVVGVARGEKPAGPLLRHGADVVVEKLTELDGQLVDLIDADDKPNAVASLDAIMARVGDRPVAMFLDYDGTLSPIVARPEDARMSDAMRQAVAELAKRCTVTIVSGRDRRDVKRFVRLEQLHYAGSHGFDITGPGGLDMQLPAAQQSLGDLDAAEAELSRRLGDVPGSQVERKRYAIAIHYRNVPGEHVARVEPIVDAVHAAHRRLRKRGGKKIFELQPDVDWDKGRAVDWLLDTLQLRQAAAFYIGDDVTDEDAFTRLGDRGVSIRVGSPREPSAAGYVLVDTEQVGQFLRQFTARLDERSGR